MSPATVVNASHARTSAGGERGHGPRPGSGLTQTQRGRRRRAWRRPRSPAVRGRCRRADRSRRARHRALPPRRARSSSGRGTSRSRRSAPGAHGARGVPQDPRLAFGEPALDAVDQAQRIFERRGACRGLAGRQGARCALACATRRCTTPSVVAAVRSQVNVSARSRAASPRRSRSSSSVEQPGAPCGQSPRASATAGRSGRRRSTRAGRRPPAPRSACRTAPPP